MKPTTMRLETSYLEMLDDIRRSFCGDIPNRTEVVRRLIKAEHDRLKKGKKGK